MDMKSARRALGWTQQRLAEKSGVPQQTVSNLENGRFRRVSYESIVRIVRAFRKAGLHGVTADELFPIPNGDDK